MDKLQELFEHYHKDFACKSYGEFFQFIIPKLIKLEVNNQLRSNKILRLFVREVNHDEIFKL